MKILILNWRDPKHPLGGGAEVMTQKIAAGWVRAGHEVVQFSSFFPGAQREETLDGVKIVRRGSHFTVHLNFWRLYRRHFFGRPDLLVDEIHFLPFFTPLLAPKVKKIALIFELAREVWFDNLFFPVALIGYCLEPLFYFFYRRTPFLTDSFSTGRGLVNLGIGREMIKIIEPGIEWKPLAALPHKADKPTFVFLGALVKDKGILAAVEAFAIINKKLPESKLWVIGRGEEKMVGKLKRRTEELGLSGRVRFFGYVDEDKKRFRLRRAHLLLNPSRREGWGIVNLEANSQATPVVGYDVVGLRDSIKNGETGVLTPVNTPSSLAQEALSLLSDRRRYRRCQRGALRWAGKHSWREVSAQSIEYLNRLDKK